MQHSADIGLISLAPVLRGLSEVPATRDQAWPAKAGAGAASAGDAGKHVVLAWLVSRVDACEPVSRGHSWRVSRLAQAFAVTLRLPPAERERLVEGALLHDVGKIAVPRDLLRRPGPLDRAEFDLVKRHAEVGGRMLAQIPALAHAAPIARWHHERWDGQGYPGSLVGTQVPIGARIVAALDALDAMTSARPYREAMSLEEALEELRSNAGKQFDPDVVQAVVSMDWKGVLEEFGSKPEGDLCNA